MTKGRLERLRAAMDEERLDALWVSGPVDDVYGRHSQNRFYVSGFTGSAGAAVVTKTRSIMVVDSRYTEQAMRECEEYEVYEYRGKTDDWLPKLIRDAELAGARIGVSAADMTAGAYERFQRALSEVPWGSRPAAGLASPIVEKLRATKDAADVAALQRAIDIGDQAFERVETLLTPGMTEVAIAKAIEEAIRDLGGQGVSFDTIVAGGAWGAQPHASPREEAVQENEPIVIDMGALAGGYCSDLTRTTRIGRFSDEMRAIYEVVFEAQQAAIEGVEAGMPGSTAHKLAEDVIARAGHGDRFGHGLGHGVGLEVHERPYLGGGSEDTLEEGMVFTIEPGIYVPGLGGVRIEDVVVLENGKARLLSHAHKLSPTGV
ncbi:MAG: Xaa-Pro peptidase family protein [Dehalococcoidia bacterium]|nr:aminopeptidase P family protein [Dehalococcoidia bacterium]